MSKLREYAFFTKSIAIIGKVVTETFLKQLKSNYKQRQQDCHFILGGSLNAKKMKVINL